MDEIKENKSTLSNTPDKEEKKKDEALSTGRKKSRDHHLKEAAEEEIQKVREQYDELNDKYLRLYSEFDNYRKRTVREKSEMSRMASAEIITELLTVLDDFERALQSSHDNKECKAVQEGLSLIHTKMKAILERKGLKPIESRGAVFNTDFHEAISRIPAPEDQLKGKVVDEIEKGYMLHDRVIRYAKVVIGD
ncbi:MAG: nucleotide exchange factor GrpE [Bacteroidales bacterium]|nr:nucleotide exchange factor GrpE [Bacteroidales bacterium]